MNTGDQARQLEIRRPESPTSLERPSQRLPGHATQKRRGGQAEHKAKLPPRLGTASDIMTEPGENNQVGVEKRSSIEDARTAESRRGNRRRRDACQELKMRLGGILRCDMMVGSGSKVADMRKGSRHTNKPRRFSSRSIQSTCLCSITLIRTRPAARGISPDRARPADTHNPDRSQPTRQHRLLI